MLTNTPHTSSRLKWPPLSTQDHQYSVPACPLWTSGPPSAATSPMNCRFLSTLTQQTWPLRSSSSRLTQTLNPMSPSRLQPPWLSPCPRLCLSQARSSNWPSVQAIKALSAPSLHRTPFMSKSTPHIHPVLPRHPLLQGFMSSSRLQLCIVPRNLKAS